MLDKQERENFREVDAEIYLNEFTKEFIERQTILTTIAIVYGLNAIAQAINPS